MKVFILGLFITSLSHAFTLNNNFGAAFKHPHVKVFVDESTVCPANDLDFNDLESLVAPAVDDFWNRVPTSKLYLDPSGFSQHIPTINHGRLCSPTDSACITAGTTDPGGLIPPVQEIIIACNDNSLNFGGGNVLAVTIPNNFSSKKITGAVILINDNGTFGSLSRADQIAVIAHEIGHAIGLGHSKQSDAMMYYRTVSLRKNLGQDDIDGVSYLYPKHVDAGGCLTTLGKNPPRSPPFSQMLIALGVMILIFEAIKLFIRPKARTAT